MTTPDTTTQISKVELPKWVEGASQENYDYAKQISQRPFQAYTGKTVAGLPQRADDYFTGSMDVGASDIARARNYGKTADNNFTMAQNALAASRGDFRRSADILNSLNKPGGDISLARNALTESMGLARRGAGGIGSLDRGKYMNPFVENVEDRALDALGRETTRGLNENASKAAAAKAFGGSRAAIIDAVTRGESSRAAGDLSATLRRDAFNEATRAMEGDLSRFFQGAGAMQGSAAGFNQNAASRIAQAGGIRAIGDSRVGSAAGFNQTGMGRLAGADRATATADQLMKQRMQNFAGLMQGDQRTQAHEQATLDDTYKRWKEKRDYPLEQLNTRLSALGMSPYGKTETTNKSSQSGMDFASIGGGLLSMLPAFMMLSDETTKTGKKRITIDNDTGIPIYEYRYKGEPKEIKRIGPMAQDVRKVFPDRVKRINGKLAIDVSAAARTFGHPDEGMTHKKLRAIDKMDRTPEDLMLRRRVGRKQMGA